MALEKDAKDKKSNAGSGTGKNTEGAGRSSVIAAGSKAFSRPIDEQKREQVETQKQREHKVTNTKPTEGGAGGKPAPEPKKNLPTGVTPLTAPKPMGATPFVEGADPIGIGARFLGGIGGAAMSALGQALSGEDPTQSMLGEHLGKQTGWSADPSMTPGRDRAQRGTTSRESFDQTTLGSASSTAPGDAAARPAARDAENFSDIQMADRRRPGLKQMLETMI